MSLDTPDPPNPDPLCHLPTREGPALPGRAVRTCTTSEQLRGAPLLGSAPRARRLPARRTSGRQLWAAHRRSQSRGPGLPRPGSAALERGPAERWPGLPAGFQAHAARDQRADPGRGEAAHGQGQAPGPGLPSATPRCSPAAPGVSPAEPQPPAARAAGVGGPAAAPPQRRPAEPTLRRPGRSAAGRRGPRGPGPAARRNPRRPPRHVHRPQFRRGLGAPGTRRAPRRVPSRRRAD